MTNSGSVPTPGRYTPRNSAIQPPSGPDDGDGTSAARKTSLSRELSDFLVELSIAMQKHAIYPGGHPLLTDAVDGVMRKISILLAERSSLSIGIARRQLIIEGVGTDPNHPLLKELAGRLHKHNLGALKFLRDLTREELGDALATIAVDSGRSTETLGDQAASLSERWENVKLYPLNYERLQLLYDGKDDEGEERIHRGGSTKAAQLWVGMARAAMMLDENDEVDSSSMTPLVVAEAIDKRQQQEAYDQVIVGYLLQIAEELKKSGGRPETIELQKHISELVKQLSPASLKKLLEMGGDSVQRRQFLLNASQGMTVEAVVDLVKAAGSDGKQSISHSMMRLFSKLSKYAENDADPVRRANAESSVREHMRNLISEWNLDDPNPTAYGKVLQRMARSGRQESNAAYIDCEPERVVQMGLELSASGPRMDVALEAMLNSARFEQLLSYLDAAPDPEFAESVWQYVDSKDILWSALTEARIDVGVLERLVKRKGLSAVDPILDVVERTKDARTRERLLDTLLPLGDDIGPYLARRIDGARADLRRDLFLMLGKLGQIPRDFDVSRFLLHTDAAVRREAVRLLLKFVETREQAIIAGVTDTDERALFYGLSAAQEGGCPQRALAIVRQRIENRDLDSSLMTLAIRVLAQADSGASRVMSGSGRTSQMMRAMHLDSNPAADATAGKKTLDWLVSRVAQKGFFGRWKLRDKSPEMLAALSALSAYWNQLPEVQEIIALATRQNDPELRKAMSAQRVTQKMRAITD
ncbi:MAG TPA: hypothetical protein VEB19_01215 [Gemmatimonadaceae bacterium]|nr:hypothetical protein [Gemmatimonadaceae bacterium]